MVVLIELFGTLRAIAKTDKINMPITPRTVVVDAIDYVKNRYPELALDKELIVTTINHEIVPPDRLLKPDDTLCFIPHIGGG